MKAKICDICCEVCGNEYVTFKVTILGHKMKRHMCERCYDDFIEYLEIKDEEKGEKEDDVTT